MTWNPISMEPLFTAAFWLACRRLSTATNQRDVMPPRRSLYPVRVPRPSSGIPSRDCPREKYLVPNVRPAHASLVWYGCLASCVKSVVNIKPLAVLITKHELRCPRPPPQAVPCGPAPSPSQAHISTPSENTRIPPPFSTSHRPHFHRFDVRCLHRRARRTWAGSRSSCW